MTSPNDELMRWTCREIAAGIASTRGLLDGQMFFFDVGDDRHVYTIYDQAPDADRDAYLALLTRIFAQEGVARFAVATFGCNAVAVGVRDSRRRSGVRIAQVIGEAPDMRLGTWTAIANAGVALDLLVPAGAGFVLH
jgi:hypothetical protein